MTQDLMDRLEQADPAALRSEPDAAEMDALLARIVASPAEDDSPRWRPLPRLLALGAAAAAVGLVLFVALDLVDNGPPAPSVVQKALAAVSGTNAIYHVIVAEHQRSTPEDPAITDGDLRWQGSSYTESWFGPGYRLHTKMFRYRHGRRGSVTSEVAGRSGVCRARRCRVSSNNGLWYNRRRNEAERIGIGPLGASRPGPPSVTIHPFDDPSARLRQALQRHELRVTGTTEVNGRKAYRLTSKRSRVAPTMFRVVMHVEFVVDAETYLPLEERMVVERHLTKRDLKNSKQPDALRAALRSGRTLVTNVDSRRFLAYERLPLTKANRSKLRIHPRPGAVLVRPDGKRVPFR